MLYISQHAQSRMQQRGIPKPVLDTLLEYGHYHHDGHGAEIVHFSGKVKVYLRKHLDRKTFANVERYFNVYAVIAQGVLITAGHRYRRIFR